MKIKFKGNCSALGFGYVGNSVHDVPEKLGNSAIKKGAAVKYVEDAPAKKEAQKAEKEKATGPGPKENAKK